MNRVSGTRLQIMRQLTCHFEVQQLSNWLKFCFQAPTEVVIPTLPEVVIPTLPELVRLCGKMESVRVDHNRS